MGETLGLRGRTEKYISELKARKDLLTLSPSPVIFDLPLDIKDIHGVEIASPSHDKAKGLFGAVDLLSRNGARVYLPHEAEVFDVVHGFGAGGNDERFKNQTNRVSLGIRLNELEFVYVDMMHLSPNADVIAAKRTILPKGFPLGVVDSTGWTTEPHLHVHEEKIFLTPETAEINHSMTKPLRIRFSNKNLMNFHARYLYPR